MLASAFPDDKPFSEWFLAGIVTFIAIGLELKSRIEKKRRWAAGGLLASRPGTIKLEYNTNYDVPSNAYLVRDQKR